MGDPKMTTALVPRGCVAMVKADRRRRGRVKVRVPVSRELAELFFAELCRRVFLDRLLVDPEFRQRLLEELN